VGFFMFIFRFVDIETFLQRDICLSSPFFARSVWYIGRVF
jgi:hypothetical protein